MAEEFPSPLAASFPVRVNAIEAGADDFIILVACPLPRGLPTTPRIAGIASTSGSSWVTSCAVAIGEPPGLKG
jgi:hypothetical protein